MAGRWWLKAFRSGWDSVRMYSVPDTLAPSPMLSVWSRYAVTFTHDRLFVVNIETGQCAPLTISWGAAIVSGGLLATSEMANAKGGSAGLRELDLTSVPPLPACTR